MSGATPSLSVLLKRTSIDDHEEVLKACNATLKHSKSDLDAQHVRVIALLKSDRYDDARRALEEGGPKLQQKAQLEHAYALYKLGRLDEARSVAIALENNRGARHIEAQASYRIEDFPHSAALYRDLLERTDGYGHEKNVLHINMGATDAQLEWKRLGYLVRKKKPGREDLEAFETAYNAACGCIARGEFRQAGVLLKRSSDLCNASDDLSHEEKLAELLLIKVQQLFVLSMIGDVEQAERLAVDIAIQDIPDHSTKNVAVYNKLAASSKPLNPFIASRQAKSAPSIPSTDNLFDFQTDIMNRNEWALDLISSKFTGVATSTSRLMRETTSPTISVGVNSASVANAAAHAQSQIGKFGLKKILPLLEKRPSDIGLALTIVQLYTLTDNYGSAILVMESLLKRLEESITSTDQDIRFAPGLVSTIISLYSVRGQKSQMKTELAKAASYWRHKSNPPQPLLRAAGLSLLDSGQSEDFKTASQLFEVLRLQDPHDKYAIAGYIAANASIETSKAEHESEKLTPVNRLIVGIDISALESAGIPKLSPNIPAAGTKKRARDTDSKPAKKRIRKSRMPKEIDPKKPPDPERWLPLRDRSSYKPKGKKGKGKAAALTQGGVSGEKGSEGLNMGTADGGAADKKGGTVIEAPSKSKKKKGKR